MTFETLRIVLFFLISVLRFVITNVQFYDLDKNVIYCSHYHALEMNCVQCCFKL